MSEEDPYAHLPLMQRPDFVYRAHKHVRARRLQVGDIVLETARDTPKECWTITRVEEDKHVGVVYCWYQGRDKKTIIGISTDRIWVARREEYPPK
jgi:hypothetical protein